MVGVGGEEQGQRETSVMKCEICLWRRRGICEGAGNQDLCGESGSNDLGDVCVGLQAVVLRLCPRDSKEAFVEDHFAKDV